MTDVFAYYFPQYHADPRNNALHGDGWTEWDVLERSRPHFPGHSWPRRPAWGAEDEARPEVAARKVAAAAAAGIDGFVVDWYFYDGAPFLSRFLDEGLLPAMDQQDFRFALMWANHPWTALYPAEPGSSQTLFSAPNGRYAFERATDLLLERYLTHPSYWRVDGRPYVSVYDVADLLTAQGGADHCRRLLDGFRDRAAAQGVPVHLNLVSSRFLEDRVALLATLGADSTTHYTWWHHDDHGFTSPVTPYRDLAAAARRSWPTYLAEPMTYLPNVTVGWDPSPRTVAWAHDAERDYPYSDIADSRTAADFADALGHALALADRHGAPAVLINAWNEWTEDSYLEPDEHHGWSYLDAIGRVRGSGLQVRPPNRGPRSIGQESA